jgi:hypothetical protein
VPFTSLTSHCKLKDRDRIVEETGKRGGRKGKVPFGSSTSSPKCNVMDSIQGETGKRGE